MHFEILVEGQAERTALEPILSKILGKWGENHKWWIHKHRGIGELPADPRLKPNPKDQTLLHNLPSKLRAYGKSLSECEMVIVLVDLDKRDCIEFKEQLINLLSYCNPSPKCLVRIAIEELEAWYFGDLNAIRKAYPKAKQSIIELYNVDSICGTWELMADALYPGGEKALKKLGEIACLQEKRKWAKNIAPLMDIENNKSPSFRVFRDGIRKVITHIGGKR